MSQETELYRLEQIVEKLLVKYDDLKAENGRLSKELAENKAQLASLEENLSIQKTERGEIGRRVSKLVEQIEEWEKSIDGSGEVLTEGVVAAEDGSDSLEEEDDEPEPLGVMEGSAVDLDATDSATDEEGEKKVEDEGRVQHNLFSMSGFQR